MAPSDLRTLAIELALVCPRCRADLPVSKLDSEVTCAACSTMTPLPWRGLLTVQLRGVDVALLDLLPGAVAGRPYAASRSDLALTATVAPLACRCGKVYEPEALARLNRLRPSLRCPCGVELAGRRPPDGLVTAYPEVLHVLGESAETPTFDSPQGVVLRCGECRALLPAGGGTCPFCGAENASPSEPAATHGSPIWLLLRLS